jgi:hypothetical protein
MERVLLLAVLLAGVVGQSRQGIGLAQYETLLVDLDDTVPAVDCNRTLEDIQVRNLLGLFKNVLYYNPPEKLCCCTWQSSLFSTVATKYIFRQYLKIRR